MSRDHTIASTQLVKKENVIFNYLLFVNYQTEQLIIYIWTSIYNRNYMCIVGSWKINKSTKEYIICVRDCTLFIETARRGGKRLCAFIIMIIVWCSMSWFVIYGWHIFVSCKLVIQPTIYRCRFNWNQSKILYSLTEHKMLAKREFEFKNCKT